ncbi:MAG: hypothetical protein FWG87_03280 [Defluviitaleaceae bacterium]|nr:hypothetical protein [Defluviitaleaceae bacterium]
MDNKEIWNDTASSLSHIKRPSNAYPCKGREVYRISCQPDNINLYTGKQRELYGKQLYVGTTNIEGQLKNMDRSDIDGYRFYIHNKTFRAGSWITAKRFKEIYESKS